MERSLLPEKCGRPRLIGTPACPRQRTFRQLLRLEHGALDGAAGVDEALALARALTLAGVDAGARDLGGRGGGEGADGENGCGRGEDGALGHGLLLPVEPPPFLMCGGESMDRRTESHNMRKPKGRALSLPFGLRRRIVTSPCRPCPCSRRRWPPRSSPGPCRHSGP